MLYNLWHNFICQSFLNKDGKGKNTKIISGAMWSSAVSRKMRKRPIGRTGKKYRNFYYVLEI